MTIYEQIIREGKREGKREGRIEGIQERRVEEKLERDKRLVIQFHKKGYSVLEMMEFMEILKENEVKDILKGFEK